MAADAEVYGWRRYMAEAARLVTENTARLAQGSYLTRSWGEPPKPKKPEKKPEDVARGIVEGAGLIYRGR